MLSEIEIVKELRRSIQSYDYLPYGDQQSLIATRRKELAAREPVVSGEVIVHTPGADAPLPRLPAADFTEAEARLALRNALADATTTENNLSRVRDLVARADDRIHDAEAALRAYESLSTELATYEISQLAEGTDAELPHSLRQAVRDKQVCLDKLERSVSARKQLAAERDKVEQANTKAQRMLHYFVYSVAVCLARQRAEKLNQLEGEAAALRSMISGLQLPGTLIMPADISAAVFTPRADIRASDSDKSAWINLLINLRSDANACLG